MRWRCDPRLCGNLASGRSKSTPSRSTGGSPGSASIHPIALPAGGRVKRWTREAEIDGGPFRDALEHDSLKLIDIVHSGSRRPERRGSDDLEHSRNFVRVSQGPGSEAEVKNLGSRRSDKGARPKGCALVEPVVRDVTGMNPMGTVADLSRLCVAVDAPGHGIGAPGWADIPIAYGAFASGTAGADRLEGAFHGPGHEEARGVFDTAGHDGAFGARHDR